MCMHGILRENCIPKNRLFLFCWLPRQPQAFLCKLIQKVLSLLVTPQNLLLKIIVVQFSVLHWNHQDGEYSRFHCQRHMLKQLVYSLFGSKKVPSNNVLAPWLKEYIDGQLYLTPARASVQNIPGLDRWVPWGGGRSPDGEKGGRGMGRALKRVLTARMYFEGGKGRAKDPLRRARTKVCWCN